MCSTRRGPLLDHRRSDATVVASAVGRSRNALRIAAGARDVLSEFVSEFSKQHISTVSLRQSGCAGLCDQEPMATLTDKNGLEHRYGKLNKSKVREIVEGHVVGGNPVTRYLVNV